MYSDGEMMCRGWRCVDPDSSQLGKVKGCMDALMPGASNATQSRVAQGHHHLRNLITATATSNRHQMSK